MGLATAEETAPLTTPAATLVYTASSESQVCGGREEEGGRRREGGERDGGEERGMEERREGGERGREEGGREGGREERGRGKREGGRERREGGREEREKERTSLQHFSGSLASAYLSAITAPPPPPLRLSSHSPLSLSSLSSHSPYPPPSLFVSPLPLLPSLLTPWVQSLEVVIKSNFEGAIGGLSEEGWDNPGVWWEGGGSRACQQEMGSN